MARHRHRILRLIDVHLHFPAAADRRALERAGAIDSGSALPVWDAERTLDVLGNVGIEYAVLSPAPWAPVSADADGARGLAREFNEELADQIADNPRTYGGVAVLPLPHVDAALDELAYALDVLKLDGAHLRTSYQGHGPDDAMFAPLLAELDRRATTVLTHATSTCTLDPDGAAPADPDVVRETSRLASNLVHGGALERYPDIGWVLGHGGPTVLGQDGEDGHDPLRGLHVDVAGVDVIGAEPMLDGLARRHRADKLLFGTGMPGASAAQVAHRIITLMTTRAVDEQVKWAVAPDNALRLFPSVARKLRQASRGRDYAR